MSNDSRIKHTYTDNSCELELKVTDSSCDDYDVLVQKLQKCSVYIGDYYFLIYFEAQLYIFRSVKQFDLDNSNAICLNANTSDSLIEVSVPCLTQNNVDDVGNELDLNQLKNITHDCSLLIDGSEEELLADKSVDYGFASNFFGTNLKFECDLDSLKSASKTYNGMSVSDNDEDVDEDCDLDPKETFDNDKDAASKRGADNDKLIEDDENDAASDLNPPKSKKNKIDDAEENNSDLDNDEDNDEENDFEPPSAKKSKTDNDDDSESEPNNGNNENVEMSDENPDNNDDSNLESPKPVSEPEDNENGDDDEENAEEPNLDFPKSDNEDCDNNPENDDENVNSENEEQNDENDQENENDEENNFESPKPESETNENSENEEDCNLDSPKSENVDCDNEPENDDENVNSENEAEQNDENDQENVDEAEEHSENDDENNLESPKPESEADENNENEEDCNCNSPKSETEDDNDNANDEVCENEADDNDENTEDLEEADADNDLESPKPESEAEENDEDLDSPKPESEPNQNYEECQLDSPKSETEADNANHEDCENEADGSDENPEDEPDVECSFSTNKPKINQENNESDDYDIDFDMEMLIFTNGETDLESDNDEENMSSDKYTLNFVKLNDSEDNPESTINFKGFIRGNEAECLLHCLDDETDFEESEEQELGCDHIRVFLGIGCDDSSPTTFNETLLKGESLAGRLMFATSKLDKYDDIKDAMDAIVYEELCKRKTNLEPVKKYIENEFHKPLHHLDVAYIEELYANNLSRFWLKEVTIILEALVKRKKRNAVRDIMLSLDDVKSLHDIPSPFRELAYNQLLMKHYNILNKVDESMLLQQFKSECLKASMADSDIAKKQLKFFKGFIEFLSSSKHLQTLIDELDLKSFCSGESDFDALLNSVLQLDANSYSVSLEVLQTSATDLLGEEDQTLIDKFKQLIETYIKPVQIEKKKIGHQTIIEVLGQHVVVSEIVDQLESEILRDTDIEEVRFIAADVLHIDIGLVNNIWHGINIVILTKCIHVHDDVVWDVSGDDSWQIYHHNAGTDADGDGKAGADGFPGESGGNILILAEKIENPDKLSIISNGGNGSKGQDGGNGVNGKDGAAMTKKRMDEDFHSPYRTGKKEELRTKVINECKTIKVDWRYGHDIFIQGVTAEGTEITYSCYPGRTATYYNCHFMVKGAPGQAGGRGGEYGLGGQGGFPGEIIVKSLFTGQKFELSATNQQGSDGEVGKGGIFGTHGKNGWDMAYMDYQYWSKPWFRGEDENSLLTKYKYSSNTDKRVYCCYCDSYIELWPTKLQANINPNNAERMKERNNMEREQKAQASRKNGIAQSSILNTYSHHLNAMEESVLQSMSSKIETDAQNASQQIDQVQQEEKTQELTVQRHVSYDKPTKYRLDSVSKSEAIFKSSSNVGDGDVINELQSDPTLLENWQKLNSIVVDFKQLDKLLSDFYAYKDCWLEEPYSQLSAIEKCLLDKYRYATLQEIAKQMPTKKPVAMSPLSAEKLSRYLIEDSDTTTLKNLFHPILGTLHQQLCQSTREQHEILVEFCIEQSLELKKHAMKRFILQKAQREPTLENIKDYYYQYTSFVEERERNLDILFTAFTSELSQPRHADLYDLWKRSNSDQTLQAERAAGIRKDIFLLALHLRCMSEKDREYDWDTCCHDADILEEFNEHLLQTGPLSAAYRESLAQAYGINLRMYTADDDDDKLYLQDNHNAAAEERIVNVLFRAGHFTQLKLNSNYAMLEHECQCKDQIYAGILSHLHALKTKQDIDDFQDQQQFYQFEVDPEQQLIFYNEQADIEEILSHFYGDERQQLASRLNTISSQYIAQTEVLRIISKRFSSEGKLVTFQELCMLFNSIIAANVDERKQPHLYRWIVASCPQKTWIDELLLLQIENHLMQEMSNKDLLREYLRKIENISVLLLFNEKLDQPQTDASTSEQCIADILQMLSSIAKETVLQLEQLELAEWPFALKEIYWSSRLSELVDWQLDELPTASYYLLCMENIFGAEPLNSFLDLLTLKMCELSADTLNVILANFHSAEWSLSQDVLTALEANDIDSWVQQMKHQYSAIDKHRNVEQLVEVITSNAHTSQNILSQLSEIQATVMEVRDYCREIDEQYVYEFNEDDIKTWSQKFRTNFKSRKPDFIDEIFAVVDRGIELINGWRLRDTQRLATLALLANERKTLAQIATGEGKSIIVVALAIIKAMCGEKVDVVTSSSVLAKRDAVENRAIYDLFDISVSHNCSESLDARKSAYAGNHVIYGDLGSFQRDYLLDVFYGKNILGKRKFENIIVDEVDSMLLDKGGNVLYLSHDLPGLDKLESLYLYIWQWLNRPAVGAKDIAEIFDTNVIKNAVLGDIFGLIQKEDMAKLGAELNEQQQNVIYERLIKYGIINERGRLLSESGVDDKLDYIIYDEFNVHRQRLHYLLRNTIERQKLIDVPNYLKPFIDLHLEHWIESAKNAYFMQAGQDYVVDVDRTGNSIDRNANITIVDRDTGTDQANSQWDEALHQFLQLKHGCKLSMQSLKAVFISNVSFFKLYNKLYGMTGTLGSQRERDLLQQMYKVDFVFMPTSRSKQFIEHKPIICTSKSDWLRGIRQSTNSLIETRSVLIICETLNDVATVHKAFGGKAAKNVHTYTRDYEAFDLANGNEKLTKGHIIIATNLAGRGTDIKIATDLEKAGGLHVCLTYLPMNNRIEQQAFGRAARKGDQGSGQLIIWHASKVSSRCSTIFELRKHCIAEELRNLAEIRTHHATQIAAEEECFNQFKTQYEQLKKHLESKKQKTEIMEILMHSCLDKWAYWLDANAKQIRQLTDERSKCAFKKCSKEFLSQLETLKVKHDEKDWLAWVKGNPVQTIKLGKYLAQNSQRKQAICLFDDVIKYEPKLAAAAHYYKAYALAKDINWEWKPLNADQLKNFKNELIEAARLFESHSSFALKAAALIGKIKKHNRDSLTQVKGYEEQQKCIADIYEVFSRSIYDILGHRITPEHLMNHEINAELAETMFKKLQKTGVLTKPMVQSAITDEQIKTISADYAVDFGALKEFLSKYQGKEIDEDEFQTALEKHITLPSREMFWKSLHEQDILSQTTEYVIVDLDKLKLADNDLLESLTERVKHNELKTKTPKANIDEIFLYAELFEQPAKTYIFRKPSLDKETHEALARKKVLTLNRKARIDRQKLESAKFATYDSITLNDFVKIEIEESEAELILEQLVELEIIEQIEVTEYKLTAQYDEIDTLQLSTFPVYEQAVKALLTASFAYRLALQKIIAELQVGSGARIKLVVKPHQILLGELLQKEIIAPVKMKATASRQGFEKAHAQIANDKKKKLQFKLNKASIDAITKKLDDLRGTLETLDVPDGQLKPFNDLMSTGKFGNVEEVRLFSLNALDLILKMEEKKWTLKMILNTIVVALLGAIQIAIGTAIEVLSVGILTNVGAALVAEGIGDILYATTALYSGYFSWNDYLSNKLASIAMTVATGGFGAFISTGAKFAKLGSKLVGPSLKIGGKKVAEMTGRQLVKHMGYKRIGKEVFKQIRTKTVEAVSSNLISSGLDVLMGNIMDIIGKEFTSRFLSFVTSEMKNPTITTSLQRAFIQLGAKDAKSLVDTLNKTHFTAETYVHAYGDTLKKRVLPFLDKLLEKAKTGTNSFKKCLAKYSVVAIESLWNTTEVLTATKVLVNDLNEKINKNVDKCLKLKTTPKQASIAKFDNFKYEVFGEWDNLLNEHIGSLIKSFFLAPLQSKGSEALMHIGKKIPKAYRSNKERMLFARFEKLKMEYQQQLTLDSTRTDRAKTSQHQSHVTTKYHKDLQKLLLKTKCPKLFASIVHENIPMELTCVSACTQVVNKILQGQGLERIAIVVECEQGISQRFPADGNDNERIIRLCLKDNAFQLSESNATRIGNSNKPNSLLDALVKAEPKLKSLTPKDFREKVATIIATDKDIKEHIKSKWHRVPKIYAGLEVAEKNMQHLIDPNRASESRAKKYLASEHNSGNHADVVIFRQTSDENSVRPKHKRKNSVDFATVKTEDIKLDIRTVREV